MSDSHSYLQSRYVLRSSQKHLNVQRSQDFKVGRVQIILQNLWLWFHSTYKFLLLFRLMLRLLYGLWHLIWQPWYRYTNTIVSNIGNLRLWPDRGVDHRFFWPWQHSLEHFSRQDLKMSFHLLYRNCSYAIKVIFSSKEAHSRPNSWIPTPQLPNSDELTRNHWIPTGSVQKLSSLALIMAGKYRTDIQKDGQTKSRTTDINTDRQSKGWHD
jgi:hypothetical protein